MMQKIRLVITLFFLAQSSLLAGTLAQFRTALGTIDVELYDKDKPVTVQNFLRYVKTGAYTNMFFHRWVPGFVIQGGGFWVTNRSTTNAQFAYVPNYGTITNEFNVGTNYSNVYGTIAMAKLSGDPNSASSQWFFNLANNAANLDYQNGGFTVFGRVVGGTNVINRFNSIAPTNGLYLANAGSPLDQLPVLSSTPTYNDLVYVDISLLNVQTKPAAGNTWEISWNSVSNRLHRVEFTTNFPPTWFLLQTTNGHGGIMKITDTNAPSARRFYRVTVDYP